MWIGDVVADRFQVLRPIGSGGMGSVFVATDLVNKGQVALKVLDLASPDAIERFMREAQVLAGLSHPGIVRYIAHGETPSRQPFLAMELLEGRDLAARLAVGKLSVEESLGVVRQAAEGLAFAHARGIVHRDVKPSNLFLVDGDPDRVKILDFGIARTTMQTRPLTESGTLLGTVGYMAPEQAMGRGEVDARADVFALGCVLFECLTGLPAFAGAHAVAVLAKVLSEEAQRVSEIDPRLSPKFDDLVQRMLRKDAMSRPADGNAVIAAIDDLGTLDHAPPSSSLAGPGSLTEAERLVASVVLAEPSHGDVATRGTISAAQVEVNIERMRDLATSFGATVFPLHGGGLLFVLSGRRTATDQAAQAAACALELSLLRPELKIAVATGRAETTRFLPVGPVIDRAAATLRAVSFSEARTPVAVDDLTVGLLGSRFELQESGAIHLLLAQRADLHAPRALLGKPTPCVGRDKELGSLELTLVECKDDSVPRVVLVTGAAGIGKTRLASEFLSRVDARGDVRSLLVRAEAVAAGSALALAKKLVRSAAGLRNGDPIEAQQARLREYVGGLVSADAASRVAEFLGEIVGTGMDFPASQILLASRGDPAVMREQKRRAFFDWIEAETRKPLLIVLEDVHWGDLPTITYLEEALRTLHDRPLMVLALGRPDVETVFPKLWGGAGGDLALHTIRLAGLTRRASERLVKAVLGDETDPTSVASVVDRADGNAFYLEELIRRLAEGATDFPETVLAMAEARLGGLEAEARRVLRAASVYGETFWSGGVDALLGQGARGSEWLETLADRELLVRAPESRFAGAREYVFRHALLRDAASATLTDEDRKVAHRLAAQWLVNAGEVDPIVLADHFERGEEFALAVPRLAQAADAAFGSGNAKSARSLAVRGAAYATGEALGVLRAIEAAAARVQADPAGEMIAVRQALSLLPPGSRHWFAALSGLAYRASVTGDPAVTSDVARALADLPEVKGPDVVQALSMRYLTLAMLMVGQSETARSLLSKLEAVEVRHPKHDAQFAGWLALARSHYEFYRQQGSPAVALRMADHAAAKFEESGNPVSIAHARYWQGICRLSIGRLAEGRRLIEVCIAEAEASGNRFVIPLAMMGLAWSDARAGNTEAAMRILGGVVAHPDPYISGHANAIVAEARLAAGDPNGAEQSSRAALERAPGARDLGLLAKQTLARALVEKRSYAEALQHAEYVLAAPSGAWCMTHLECHLARIRALDGLGDSAALRTALQEARAFALRAASTFEDPAAYRSFLETAAPTAEILELARERLGDEREAQTSLRAP